MENLIQELQNRYKLSLDSAEKLSKVIEVIQFQKGDTFIRAGKINTTEYLILEGICRSFLENVKGQEVTLSFFNSSKTISPNLTRTKNLISILNVQALTDIKLASFPTLELMRLMNENRAIEMWGNGILQKELMQKVSKEINHISLGAKERLLTFRKEYPLLENQISHSYISSYLGITNVSLSRIRKEISNNRT